MILANIYTTYIDHHLVHECMEVLFMTPHGLADTKGWIETIFAQMIYRVYML